MDCAARQMCDKAPVTNNDILRRIRYLFDYADQDMLRLWAEGGRQVTLAAVEDMLRRDEDPLLLPCADELLAAFLNGLIIANRGRREGPTPEPEVELSNNAILVKLRIAFGLRAEEVVDVLGLAGLAMSKHEVSAFFRKPTHRQYRACGNQVLRNFLQGLQLRYSESDDPAGSPETR